MSTAPIVRDFIGSWRRGSNRAGAAAEFDEQEAWCPGRAHEASPHSDLVEGAPTVFNNSGAFHGAGHLSTYPPDHLTVALPFCLHVPQTRTLGVPRSIPKPSAPPTEHLHDRCHRRVSRPGFLRKLCHAPQSPMRMGARTGRSAITPPAGQRLGFQVALRLQSAGNPTRGAGSR